MGPDVTHDLRAAAARNNVLLCEAVCRTHGVHGTTGASVWWTARRPPAYYPDVVTLSPGAGPADVLAHLGADSPGAVKDSFAALDLASHGFRPLPPATWIHRPAPAAPAGGSAAPVLPAERVTTAARLRDWERAWHGDDRAPDVFRPALLADPSVRVLAFRDGADRVGGAVLNEGAGLVGVSNAFAADGREHEVWASAVAAASRCFPGRALVGYEDGDALPSALEAGFRPLDPLRIWLRDS